MGKPSMPKYLEYLGSTTRTMGWGALLIYDRAKTNQLLAQEYVENLTSQAYFPPFSSTEDTGQYSKTVMSNFRFDAPVLSFTNSNISSSRARLSMKITHGQYITLNKPLGGTDHSIVSIATIDALNSPSLHMDIDLQATDSGNIIKDEGEVVLDLSEGENHTFALSSSEDRNRVLGLAVKRHFDSWDVKSKRFVLNRIVRNDNSIKPTSFAIRTHSLARSAGLFSTQEDNDEGAVIIGVAMNDQPNGSFPVRDSDLPYLLPDAFPGSDIEPLSTNLLLSNAIWFPEIMRAALTYLDKLPGTKYTLHVNSKRFFDGIDITDGQSQTLGASFRANPPGVKLIASGPPNSTWYENHYFLFEFSAQTFNISGMTARFNNKKMTVQWSGEHPVRVTSYIKRAGHPDSDAFNKYSDLTFTYDLEKVYEWHIVADGPESQSIRFKQVSSRRDSDLRGYWVDGINNAKDHFHKQLEAFTFEILDTYCAALTTESATIETLFLHNLLFQSHLVATPQLMEAPGDLTLLGTLAPEKLHFALHPVTSIISANSTLQFVLESAPPDVTWSVEMLPGENGERGIISAGGLYRAPSPSSIPAQGRRVKVIARKDQYVAQALIYLVRSNISVYPTLQVAQHSHIRYLLVAGSGDGTPLNWDVTPTSLGSVRAVTSQDRLDMNIPADQDVQIYVSPPVPTAFSAGWQEALQLDQVTVTGQSGPPQLIDILIPWKNPASWFVTEHIQGGVRLRMWVQGISGAIELKPDEADWYVVKGIGEIKDGVYIPGATPESYAIIAAIEKDDRFLNYAYIVLPFALIDLKTLEMSDAPLAL